MNFTYEQNLQKNGYPLIAGLDEAGRGPLARPVVAAAVIFNFTEIPEKLQSINDSKKLSPKKREEFFNLIIQHATDCGVGICDHQTIDRINILEATFLAMKKALGAIKHKPDIILIDGNLPISNYSSPQKPIINGDNLIFSIAAASIIAKVTRDRIMEEMHIKYPSYLFSKHKGYGTKLHMDALKLYGPCEIHRKTFRPVKMLLNSK